MRLFIKIKNERNIMLGRILTRKDNIPGYYLGKAEHTVTGEVFGIAQNSNGSPIIIYKNKRVIFEMCDLIERAKEIIENEVVKEDNAEVLEQEVRKEGLSFVS
ncbi:hypothetical protein ACTGV6_06980 [Streptococcus suis]|uniref:hypothetical protein n=2 Tax=Streptococcus suis TaxID=1307 RepID=UPI001B0482D4|nr:hypothetical protein [Streptococcus suis]